MEDTVKKEEKEEKEEKKRKLLGKTRNKYEEKDEEDH